MGDRSRTASITGLELSYISAALLEELQFRLAVGVDASTADEHIRGKPSGDATLKLRQVQAYLWTRAHFFNSRRC